MRYMIILALLLFEPIVIDEQTMRDLITGAHANFRGTEYDIFVQMLNQLENKAAAEAAKKATMPEQK